MVSYGDFEGVTVVTSAKTETKQKSLSLKPREYKLVTAILWLTAEMHHEQHPIVGVDIDAAERGLRCYDYSKYEARPMIWKTLEKIQDADNQKT